MRRRHLVIVQPAYLALIAAGRKSVEARLMRQRRPPLGRVAADDVLYFKPPGGPVRLRGRIRRVRQWSGLTPADVRALHRRYGTAVAAPPEFWHQRLEARYAVLVWFDQIRIVCTPPTVARQYGSGWVVL